MQLTPKQLAASTARTNIAASAPLLAKGEELAIDIDALYSANINIETALTEKYDAIKGQDTSPNQHNILTGQGSLSVISLQLAGTICGKWTSSKSDEAAIVGQHDRLGGNTSPDSLGCGAED